MKTRLVALPGCLGSAADWDPVRAQSKADLDWDCPNLFTPDSTGFAPPSGDEPAWLAGYSFGATGGHCDATELPPSVTTPTPGIANGPDAIRAKVRRDLRETAIKKIAGHAGTTRATGPNRPSTRLHRVCRAEAGPPAVPTMPSGFCWPSMPPCKT